MMLAQYPLPAYYSQVDYNATYFKWITQAVSTMFYRLNVNSL